MNKNEMFLYIILTVVGIILLIGAGVLLDREGIRSHGREIKKLELIQGR